MVTLAAVATLAACHKKPAEAPQPVASTSTWQRELMGEVRNPPEDAPQKWRGLIGEYGADSAQRWIALERDQRLYIRDQFGNFVPLTERNDSLFEAPLTTAAVSGAVRFHRDETGRATSVQVADMVLERRRIEPPSGANQLRITPVRSVDELKPIALAATPPKDTTAKRAPDLVELTSLDSTIKLEIRYATRNNFLGTQIYDTARAFMERPAANALERANKTLAIFGLGLLIHDAYRPWYVTKIFWDATPDSVKWLVANPTEGSRHNRGAAVDLTLYELSSGRVVEMPSTYDESTTRAYADYAGGTARQRWYRALLRKAMEHEGFTVNPREWWHFDYKDWKQYPILNVPFNAIGNP